MECVEDRDVRTVAQEECFGVGMGRGLLSIDCWVAACFPAVNCPQHSVVDEIGQLSAGFSSATVKGNPAVLTRVDEETLQKVIRGVSHGNYYGVEAYGVLDFLQLIALSIMSDNL